MAKATEYPARGSGVIEKRTVATPKEGRTVKGRWLRNYEERATSKQSQPAEIGQQEPFGARDNHSIQLTLLYLITFIHQNLSWCFATQLMADYTRRTLPLISCQFLREALVALVPQ